MLAVQVQYWDLQERKRHNKVAERQNDRSLNLQESNLEETRRHNVATETLGFSTLEETRRHNVATEQIQEQSNSISMYRAESDRMNALTNMRNAATNAAMIPIQWYNAESTRMNVENSQWYNEQRVDLERDRNNISRFQSVTGAAVGYANTDIGSQNAQTNYTNAQTQQERNRIQEEMNKSTIQYNYDKMDWDANQKQKDRNLERAKLYFNTLINGWRNLNESLKEN